MYTPPYKILEYTCGIDGLPTQGQGDTRVKECPLAFGVGSASGSILLHVLLADKQQKRMQVLVECTPYVIQVSINKCSN